MGEKKYTIDNNYEDVVLTTAEQMLVEGEQQTKDSASIYASKSNEFKSKEEWEYFLNEEKFLEDGIEKLD